MVHLLGKHSDLKVRVVVGTVKRLLIARFFEDCKYICK